MELLQTLQDWYAKQCNGEWEHYRGIKIETVDNPGWLVQIDLVGTSLDTCLFRPVAENADEAGFQKGERWLHCHSKEGVWHGAGDETKLTVILETFLSWADKNN